MLLGKLGKKAPKLDSRTLKLSKYLLQPGVTSPLPPPPAEVSWVMEG